jgi:hypothetical protein
MLVDDLSVRLSVPDIIAVTGQPGNINLTWNSMPTRTYSVLFSSTLTTNFSTWTTLATNITGSGFAPYTASYQDSANHGAWQRLLCHPRRSKTEHSASFAFGEERTGLKSISQGCPALIHCVGQPFGLY